ncbi:MAG: hypothetical protein ACP5LE_04100 [Thermoplasmata archaeon]
MSSIAELNWIAWELALAFVRKDSNGKIRAYSKRILQKILGTLSDKNYIEEIKDIAENYNPPDRDKEKVREFVENKLLPELKKMDAKAGKALMKYILWNVKTLENVRGEKEEKKLRIMLCAEGIDEKKIEEFLEKFSNLKSEKGHGMYRKKNRRW